jgi:transposase
MKFAGCDLHKQSITVCVVNQSREVLLRRTLLCINEGGIRRFFEELGELVESLAHRVLLAHPQKLRVIAESTRKSDRLDAQALAEFLALDMIPTSYRPTPRQREHRVLVRQRDRIQRRLTSVKNRLRRVLSNYNADRRDLCSLAGLEYLDTVPLSDADRFVVTQLTAELRFGRGQLQESEQRLKQFATESPLRERELRELLRTIPGVGFVTAEVILAELADITRFGAQKQVVAYAGLSPGQRESAGKSRELHLEKNGSKLLRWALVEAAWRLIRHSPRWRGIYEKLKVRVRAKKAIVAVARRLLCLVTAILKTGQPFSATYQPA